MYKKRNSDKFEQLVLITEFWKTGKYSSLFSAEMAVNWYGSRLKLIHLSHYKSWDGYCVMLYFINAFINIGIYIFKTCIIKS